MQRRLAELDRLDEAHRTSGGDPSAIPTSTGPPRLARPATRPIASALKAVVVLSVVLAGGATLLRSEYGITVGLSGLRGPERPLEPVDATGDGGSFAFTQEQGGRPVTYNPCRPIEIVVNDVLAPTAGQDLVHEAISSVSAATGLEIRIAGTTDEQPAENREVRQPARYGPGWAPVLLAWTTPEVAPRLEGDVAGVAGSVAISAGLSGARRYVTGVVVLDAPQFNRLLQLDQGREQARAIVMHELGHLVGLAHVDDPLELMTEEGASVTEFGRGDLEGLAALGRGPCH